MVTRLFPYTIKKRYITTLLTYFHLSSTVLKVDGLLLLLT